MTRYPLSWPTGWKRTEAGHRKTGRFKSSQRALSVADGADRTLDVLRRMGIGEKEIVISTNVEPTLSGRPRSNQAEPKDPGVAVYWTVRRYQWDRSGNEGRTVEQHRVMAIDLYTCVADNLGAVAATLEAMRAIERHGGAQILERAFTGFDALPSPNDWRHVLGFEQTPTFDQAKERYRELAKKRHPDRGGSEAAMAELTRAWEQAQSDYARSL